MGNLTNSHLAPLAIAVNHALDLNKSCSAVRSPVLMGTANGIWAPLVHLTAKCHVPHRIALSQPLPKAVRMARRLFAVPELLVRFLADYDIGRKLTQFQMMCRRHTLKPLCMSFLTTLHVHNHKIQTMTEMACPSWKHRASNLQNGTIWAVSHTLLELTPGLQSC